MKKVIALLLCFALCLSLTPSVLADTQTAEYHLCQKCNQTVTWTAFDSGKTLLQQAGHYHLYLSEDYIGSQISLASGVELCLDLYGKDITIDGRLFTLTKDSGAKLNFMDTIGGSTVTATSSNGNPAADYRRQDRLCHCPRRQHRRPDACRPAGENLQGCL